MLLAWTLVLLIFSWDCHAALRNVTIDDSYPDPETGKSIIYEPAGAWNDGKNCTGCTAHPEESGMYDSTWHDSTFNAGTGLYPNVTMSASATFTGTAVYVQCVLAHTTSGPSGYSDMSFFVDGNLVGTFVKPAPGTTGYDYDVTVYYNTTLTPGDHTIRIQNGHVGGIKSLIILDRIIYTTGTADSTSSASPSSTSSSKSSTPTATIAGATVGGVVGLVAVLLAVFFFLRYRKRQQQSSSQAAYAPSAFTDDTQPFAFPPHPPQGSNASGQAVMSVAHSNPSLNHAASSSNLYSNVAASGSFYTNPTAAAAVVPAGTAAYSNFSPNRRDPSSPGGSSYDPYGGYESTQAGQSHSSQSPSSQGPPSSNGAGYGAGMGYVTSGGVKADYHPQMVAHNRDPSSSGGGTVAGDAPPPAYEGHARPEPSGPVGKR